MKKLYLNTGGFNTIFEELKDSFNGELTTENKQYNLHIKSKWAKGTISGIRFEKEMSYLHFDLEFTQDVSLSIESFQNAPVFFAYCENGTITHSFGAGGERKCIKKQHTGILNNTSSINSVLFFEGFKKVKFTLIGMPTASSNRNEDFEFISQLKEKFTNDSGNFIYVGNQNFKIAEKLQEIKSIPQKGIVANLLKKQILKDILEMEIAQHSYNYLTTFDPILHLATKQINELKRISNLSFSQVFHSTKISSRNFFPRFIKEKYHLSFKPYNQKLAS